ncbi:MAG: tetratricopeptide repeat protein, partial [Rhizomicrobium sp.]
MNRKQRRTEKAAGDAIALHADGVQAFVAGNLDLAANLITQAIAANSQLPDFHYNLAIVRKAQGKLKKAAASYSQAIALKPDYADAHNNLGNIWKDLGETDKARASFEQALAIRPGNPDTHYSLGILYSEAGDQGKAALHLRHCLERDPDDSRGAGILLAHLGAAHAPDRTPNAHLLKLYDVRARFWDQENTYFAPRLVADALRQHAPRAKLDILDIGCGTGLMGAAVRDLAQRLDGVDLSPAMLEKAHAKSVYDRLEQAEIVSFLAAHPNSYDAIAGAATLIHFGDLRAVFQAAAASLRDNGLFVFTLFSQDDADFAVAASSKLAQSGCYRHSAAYVERLAPDCGFSVVAVERVIHEHDQDGNPVPGL